MNIHRVIQNLTSGNVGASDLQQAQPFAKQSMCNHMLDTANCKDEGTDDATGQILNRGVYKGIQYFSKEYLKRCKGVTPDQIIDFLENYRMLLSSVRAKSQSTEGSTCRSTVYKEPSANFNPKIEVAALFIEHENRILLLHRQENKSQGNLWGIPGGTLDKGETPVQAVLREIKEETGYDFSNQSLENLGVVYIEYDDHNHFVYHMFRAKLVGDPAAVKINFHEHKGFTWVTPKDGLKLELIKGEEDCFKLIYDL